MALLSTHTLNSVDGTHAGGVNVDLYRLDPAGDRVKLLETRTDDDGRLSEIIVLTPETCLAQFEMVLKTGEYFSAQPTPVAGQQIMKEVVIRFSMPDAEAKYHIPLMLAPHSYSVWWSTLATPAL